jgi:hypothetical protein
MSAPHALSLVLKPGMTMLITYISAPPAGLALAGGAVVLAAAVPAVVVVVAADEFDLVFCVGLLGTGWPLGPM